MGVDGAWCRKGSSSSSGGSSGAGSSGAGSSSGSSGQAGCRKIDDDDDDDDAGDDEGDNDVIFHLVSLFDRSIVASFFTFLPVLNSVIQVMK